MTPKRQFIIFLTTVVGFVLLLMLIFGRGNSSRSNSKKTEVKRAFHLTDYANKNAKIVIVVDGPINGDDKHRAVRFTVTPEARVAEVVNGYQGKVVKTQNQPNNPSAFADFVYALSKTGFGKERKTSIVSEQGVCATGRRYVYEVYDNNKRVSRTWTAGCVQGSSAAQPGTVYNLALAQITDYNKFVSGVWQQ